MALDRELRCLQIILDRGRLAMDLMYQVIREQGIHVVLGQEPCVAEGSLVRYRCDDAFIWLAPGVSVQSIHRDRGFVAAELDGVTLVSAYFSPNRSTASFEAWIRRLEGYVRGRDGRKVLIAGDLNAKSGRFGSWVTNAYGRVLEEFLEAVELVPINTGGEWTFGNRNGRSLIDVTMVGTTVHGCVRDWNVEVGMESGSGHKYISYRLARRGTVPVGVDISEKKVGWKVNEKGLGRLSQYVMVHDGWGEVETPEGIVREISEACDQCLRKRESGNAKREVY
ncbi:uncharacterized protein [Euwallacea similis]|uniref:uncharacterized protein n=1 Tax=Euwallacea similis TaxID=1736056 RepID=UPI00344D8708